MKHAARAAKIVGGASDGVTPTLFALVDEEADWGGSGDREELVAAGIDFCGHHGGVDGAYSAAVFVSLDGERMEIATDADGVPVAPVYDTDTAETLWERAEPIRRYFKMRDAFAARYGEMP